MPQSEKNWPGSRFSAIYVEDAAYAYDLTRSALERLTGIPVITIRHYKDVFNRVRQNPLWQKQHPALILAVKQPPFLYPGSPVCQTFGHRHVATLSLLIGCPFACDYCYLQGLYPSAHLLAFVNWTDFASAIADPTRQDTLFLAASFDTDLLALHPLIPYLDLLYPTIAGRDDLVVEVRTKSAGHAFYQQHEPLRQLIMAYSLAPEAVIARYEQATPSLTARLRAIKAALARGFQVRLVFDPVLIDPALDETYAPFFDQVFAQLDPRQLVDVGYGFFRMPKVFYRRIARLRPEHPLYLDQTLQQSDIVTYADAQRQAVADRHLALLRQYLMPEKIYIL